MLKLQHEDKTISSDVYKNNNWKTDEVVTMIFIAQIKGRFNLKNHNQKNLNQN
nr:hypothetical protein [Mycoplasmopsis bovis]